MGKSEKFSIFESILYTWDNQTLLNNKWPLLTIASLLLFNIYRGQPIQIACKCSRTLPTLMSSSLFITMSTTIIFYSSLDTMCNSKKR